MLKDFRILTLWVMFALAACATNDAKKPVDSAATPIDPQQQMAIASNWVREKNWPQASEALRVLIDASTFSGLATHEQYNALNAASIVSFNNGNEDLGYSYLSRVVAMPEAGFEQWRAFAFYSSKRQNQAAAINALTVIAKRWPEQLSTFNDSNVLYLIREAGRLPANASRELLSALYAAHWKPGEGRDPSSAWRDLTLFLLADGNLNDALDVSSHVSDPYVLIAMRADRRCDALVAARSKQFDVDAAAAREFHESQAESEKSPRSLALKISVIRALQNQQRYPAMLAAADALVLELQSTNYPEKLYDDYFTQYNWLLNVRARALERLSRWDDAVEQMTAASRALENHDVNTSQTINLAELYVRLGRPKDALLALEKSGRVGAYGAMQVEAVRLQAAVQLNDQQQAKRSLEYLHVHADDAPITYMEVLIIANRLNEAAQYMIVQLQDPRRREEFLLGVQEFRSYPETEWSMKNEARLREVLARGPVQKAINKIGRVERYQLEEP